jgi:hypothetical protein
LPPLIDESVFPGFRSTFRYFSRNGVMTHSSGVMSGGLKIRLRRGFSKKTHVSVSYEDHSVFIEVEGSPLEGDVEPQVIFSRLKATGTVEDPENT